jgi:hypothetical protein
MDKHNSVLYQWAIDNLKKSGVQFVVIGLQNSRVNNADNIVLVALAMCVGGRSREVYLQDRVWILELPSK